MGTPHYGGSLDVLSRHIEPDTVGTNALKTPRLVELRHVLQPTDPRYPHCDPRRCRIRSICAACTSWPASVQIT